MLQVLAEVVGPKEFFALIAFSELVRVGQMLTAGNPVLLRLVGELHAAVAAYVEFGMLLLLLLNLLLLLSRACVGIRGHGGARMEGGADVAVEDSTRPGLAS